MEENKKSLEETLMDYEGGRYTLVALARDWMHVLRRGEDGKTMSEADLIKKALDDVATGRVLEKEITEEKAKVDAILQKIEAEKAKNEPEDEERMLKSKNIGKKGDKHKK